MTEKWKAVKGYEGLYEVSDHGRVRITDGMILKGQKSGEYREIKLAKNRTYIKYKIHRLVAIAFIPNPNNYPIINHIDEDPSNNHVSNLEWCTYKYNTNYGTCIKRRAINHYKKINQYNGKKLIKKWDSIKEASIKLNIDRSSISKAAKNKRRTAGGFIWRYD